MFVFFIRHVFHRLGSLFIECALHGTTMAQFKLTFLRRLSVCLFSVVIFQTEYGLMQPENNTFAAHLI